MAFTAKPLAFPNATTLDELFAIVRPYDKANPPEPPKVQSWDDKRDFVPIGPYCTVSGKRHEALHVVPNEAVMAHIRQRMILGSNDTVNFKCVMRDDGTCLVTADNSQIIGGTWLALIPAEDVERRFPPVEPTEPEPEPSGATQDREHFDKYHGIAQSLGFDELRAMVAGIADPDRIRACLVTDKYLNNIPLRRWDAVAECSVRQLARRAGYRAWSLSDGVCVLKHVARHVIAGEPAPDKGVVYSHANCPMAHSHRSIGRACPVCGSPAQPR